MSQQLLNLLGSAPGGDKLYVEDVFSTYLYTGNGSTGQTIVNGIDLAGEGGMVWAKIRDTSTQHVIASTETGTQYDLSSSSDSALNNEPTGLTAFNSDGFTVGGATNWNYSNHPVSSWTFRKAPKFFDMVTWTGNDGASREISHNLGSVPAVVIIKCTSTGGTNWLVSSLIGGTSRHLYLNDTGSTTSLNIVNNGGGYVYVNASTDTTFNVFASNNGSVNYVNASGRTYVAYLFASDAGGFGDSGEESIIKCGVFTTDGSSNAAVNIGWEPQWLLIKCATSVEDWRLVDTMRGFDASGDGYTNLKPNKTDSESYSGTGGPTPTGFEWNSAPYANQTFLYIAVRRGPMKTPESATDVFNVTAYSGNSTDRLISSGFPTDVAYVQPRNQPDGYGIVPTFVTRLARSPDYQLTTTTDGAEASRSGYASNGFHSNQGMLLEGGYQTNQNSYNYVMAQFRRAPGFFDTVRWTGDDAAPRNIPHNLGVVPEFIIVKRRNGTSNGSWACYHTGLTSAAYTILIESTAAQQSATNAWRSTAPTSSVFTVGNDSWVNAAGNLYIGYLFATLAGISKVGSYTGTGTAQTIDCGFSSGARFVLVKRIDGIGSWFVFDSARGIVSGNDPVLSLNNANAEQTSEDWIDPAGSGFIADQNINTAGQTYIFLAIA